MGSEESKMDVLLFDLSDTTVDGRNPQQPPGMKKPCK